MSRRLLERLNGGRRGLFHEFLGRFSDEPRIAWYPSAGRDMRDLLYVNEAFYRDNPPNGKDARTPDLYLHTDYFPWSRSEFLDNSEIFNDGRTKITIEAIEELPRCRLEIDPNLVDFPEGGPATDRVVFMNVRVRCGNNVNYMAHVLYAFVENTAFFTELVLPEKGVFSHVIHNRYGGGLGGGERSTGIWIFNILEKVRCEVFITDDRYQNRMPGDEYIYGKYHELDGDESMDGMTPVREIPAKKWSNYGDKVTWLQNDVFAASGAPDRAGHDKLVNGPAV